MGRLAKASEVMAAGFLIRGDPASEITPSFTGTRLRKPAGLFIAHTGRGSGGRAHRQVAIASGADGSVCSKPSDLRLPNAAMLTRVDDPHRAMR